MDEIKKAAQVEKQALRDEELALVNQYSLRPLTADEVFVFRVAACNDQVDRDHERFTRKTLDGLAKLYPGKAMLMDHSWTASKQTARIYAADVEEAGGVTRLVLRAYMLRSEQTASVIAAIEGGILREVSVGCAVEKALCSVCGADKARQRCAHVPGLEYEGNACHTDLDGAKDAYECSFTPVPAQPGAGVVKKYGGEDAVPEKEEPAAGEGLALRLRLLKENVRINEMEE